MKTKRMLLWCKRNLWETIESLIVIQALEKRDSVTVWRTDADIMKKRILNLRASATSRDVASRLRSAALARFVSKWRNSVSVVTRLKTFVLTSSFVISFCSIMIHFLLCEGYFRSKPNAHCANWSEMVVELVCQSRFVFMFSICITCNFICQNLNVWQILNKMLYLKYCLVLCAVFFAAVMSTSTNVRTILLHDSCRKRCPVQVTFENAFFEKEISFFDDFIHAKNNYSWFYNYL